MFAFSNCVVANIRRERINIPHHRKTRKKNEIKEELGPWIFPGCNEPSYTQKVGIYIKKKKRMGNFGRKYRRGVQSEPTTAPMRYTHIENDLSRRCFPFIYLFFVVVVVQMFIISFLPFNSPPLSILGALQDEDVPVVTITIRQTYYRADGAYRSGRFVSSSQNK